MKIRVMGFLSVLLASLAVVTEGEGRETESIQPRTALVLSGGGARGAAHVGVLGVLEELQIPVDLVIGTSIGSAVGGMYASGYSIEEMRDVLRNSPWDELFNDRPARKFVSYRNKQDDDLPLFRFEMGLDQRGFVLPSGLIAGQKLGFLLESLFVHTADVSHFNDLRLPFRAVVTDLRSGEMIVVEEGSLGRAIRASMSVPGAFAPVDLDGRLVVDGGLVRNLPVDVARELGAERIIAVDVSSTLEELTETTTMINVAGQTIGILGMDTTREQRALLGEADVLIVPELEGIGANAFRRDALVDAADRGAEAARRATDQLRRFSVPMTVYESFQRKQRRARKLPEIVIDRVNVDGLKRVDPRQVLGRIRVQPGKQLILDDIRRDLERLYEIGEFQQIGWDLQQVDGEMVLAFHAEEKAWGPNYIRFGLGLSADFEGNGQFTTLAQLTRTQLNRLGAESKTRISIGTENRLFSELFQPLDYRGRFFVAPWIDVLNTEVSSASESGELERVRIDLYRAQFDVGVQFGTVGELRLGLTRGTGDVDILTESTIPSFDFEVAGARALFSIDRFDNANFPRHGAFLESRLYFSRESLGADSDYEKADLFIGGAGSFGKNTVLGFGQFGSNLGSDIPFFERFELGGLFNVSGLPPGSIEGNVGGAVTMSYFRRVGSMPRTIGEGIYLGGSVEVGGAWDRFGDARLSDTVLAGSVFTGVDTMFGPIYLAYGREVDTGQGSFYLFLGQLFSSRQD